MTVRPLPGNERLVELLADNATEGLDCSEYEELAELLGHYNGFDADELARPAAALQVAALKKAGRLEPLPENMRRRLNAQADRFFGDVAQNKVLEFPRPAPQESDRVGGTRAWPGWAVAAALLLALIAVVMPTRETTPEIAAQREALLGTADDAIVAAWAPSEESGFEQVQGDVVWSDRRQQGFLRFTGLAANDPATAQYQLWIIDPERDERPVDGGVFDVPATGSEVIVAIDAKLAVSRPTAFAITLEQPGGVVVSDGPLLVVAPTG